MRSTVTGFVLLVLSLLLVETAVPVAAPDQELPANSWVQLDRNPVAGRRGSSFRHVPDEGTFFLWGFMNHDYQFVQENVTMTVPEHDMVSFDWKEKQWRNHLPRRWEEEWTRKLPPVFVPRCYHGITSGSERSLFRPPEGYPDEAARPDVNLVFDQVAYHPPGKSLVYFTGGLTVAYDVPRRRWTNLVPATSPPPVLGGSLAYDPLHQEIVLFGGGNVAEPGPDGRIVGHTGTWCYSFATRTWRPLALDRQPPPRLNTRMVCDTRTNQLVLFGGDGHSHYLADTWLFDLKTRRWRQATASGPEARAGHFTIFDPMTGWVIIGGGYNRKDLTDMWAFDVEAQAWKKLAGEVPTGFDIAADFDPVKRLLLLTANTQKSGDTKRCDVLYPVRTTHAYRLEEKSAVLPDRPQPQEAMPKRPAAAGGQTPADPKLLQQREEELRRLPVNQWILLKDPGRVAPTRSWGSATFDSDRGRILYWGGGHCSYGGSDVDMYDVARHTWISSPAPPDYPHRLWNHGVRLAGVTLHGQPFTEHGRRIYAHDPTSRRMIMVQPIRLTTGYVPDFLKDYPGEPRAAADARVKPPTTYKKYATWSFDPDAGRWDLLGPAPLGVDTLVTTGQGVVGLNVDWPGRLNDAGYLLPWSPEQPAGDTALYRFDPALRSWRRLGDRQVSPQNLYEMTSLVHDSRREVIYLHGGGARRDELWSFDLKRQVWKHLQPRVAGPAGTAPPVCNREMVYLPDQDVVLTFGPAPERNTGPALWAYHPADNVWHRQKLEPPPGVAPGTAAGQNRAMVADVKRDLVYLILGEGGDRGTASVFALRYRKP
jgi:hypothetical protein